MVAELAGSEGIVGSENVLLNKKNLLGNTEDAKAIKLSDVYGEVSDLNDEQKEVLTQLQAIERSHWLLRKQLTEEFGMLREKYEASFAPLYNERASILLRTKESGPLMSPSATSIPEFWLKTLSNCVAIAGMIEEHDLPILKYLTNIESEFVGRAYDESFVLRFTFAENPFFEDSVLTQTINMYSMSELEQREPEKNLDWSIEGKSTVGTKIAWKPGKDVTKKSITRKQRNRRTNEKRVVEQLVDKPSFFLFFASRERPELPPTVDESHPRFLMLIEFENQIQLALKIRDRIIPKAVSYFLNVADTDSIYSDTAEDDCSDLDDDDDDDDDC